MKVLVDADLILVAYLNQDHWQKEVYDLWDLIELGRIKAHITEYGLSQIVYFVSKLVNREKAEELFIDIQDVLQILPTGANLYQQAAQLNPLNFNSALEVVTAIDNNLDAVVTLTPYMFTGYNIKVVSLTDLLTQLERSFLESCLYGSSNLEKKQITSLSQWLHEKTSQDDWQYMEEFFNYLPVRWNNNSYINDQSSIKRCKLIKLQTKVEKINVVLVISIEPQNDRRFLILIQVFPINSAQHLLEGLKMAVLDECENELQVVIATRNNNFIQCSLTGGHSDLFSIKIMLNEITFIENFVI